jgi:hypothetical protein
MACCTECVVPNVCCTECVLYRMWSDLQEVLRGQKKKISSKIIMMITLSKGVALQDLTVVRWCVCEGERESVCESVCILLLSLPSSLSLSLSLSLTHTHTHQRSRKSAPARKVYFVWPPRPLGALRHIFFIFFLFPVESYLSCPLAPSDS